MNQFSGTVPLTDDVDRMQEYDTRSVSEMVSMCQAYVVGSVIPEHQPAYEDVEVKKMALELRDGGLVVDFVATYPEDQE